MTIPMKEVDRKHFEENNYLKIVASKIMRKLRTFTCNKSSMNKIKQSIERVFRSPLNEVKFFEAIISL